MSSDDDEPLAPQEYQENFDLAENEIARNNYSSPPSPILEKNSDDEQEIFLAAGGLPVDFSASEYNTSKTNDDPLISLKNDPKQKVNDGLTEQSKSTQETESIRVSKDIKKKKEKKEKHEKKHKKHKKEKKHRKDEDISDPKLRENESESGNVQDTLQSLEGKEGKIVATLDFAEPGHTKKRHSDKKEKKVKKDKEKNQETNVHMTLENNLCDTQTIVGKQHEHTHTHKHHKDHIPKEKDKDHYGLQTGRDNSTKDFSHDISAGVSHRASEDDLQMFNIRKLLTEEKEQNLITRNRSNSLPIKREKKRASVLPVLANPKEWVRLATKKAREDFEQKLKKEKLVRALSLKSQLGNAEVSQQTLARATAAKTFIENKYRTLSEPTNFNSLEAHRTQSKEPHKRFHKMILTRSTPSLMRSISKEDPETLTFLGKQRVQNFKIIEEEERKLRGECEISDQSGLQAIVQRNSPEIDDFDSQSSRVALVLMGSILFFVLQSMFFLVLGCLKLGFKLLLLSVTVSVRKLFATSSSSKSELKNESIGNGVNELT